jgi:hypothetical protein
MLCDVDTRSLKMTGYQICSSPKSPLIRVTWTYRFQPRPLSAACYCILISKARKITRSPLACRFSSSGCPNNLFYLEIAVLVNSEAPSWKHIKGTAL